MHSYHIVAELRQFRGAFCYHYAQSTATVRLTRADTRRHMRGNVEAKKPKRETVMSDSADKTAFHDRVIAVAIGP
jgi:hypothetical protein